eukprot:8021562-Pyramimonas_sp.AAC.1
MRSRRSRSARPRRPCHRGSRSSTRSAVVQHGGCRRSTSSARWASPCAWSWPATALLAEGSASSA